MTGNGANAEVERSRTEPPVLTGHGMMDKGVCWEGTPYHGSRGAESRTACHHPTRRTHPNKPTQPHPLKLVTFVKNTLLLKE